VAQAITHFAVGATLTTLLETLLPAEARYPAVLALVGGAWAMLPDASKLVDSDAVYAFHYPRWADLFWGHRTLDRIDGDDSTLLGAVAVAAFVLVTAVGERRSYRSARPSVPAEPVGVD
jgi:membrane-bound metal-dependent hydrolase YbcI (DUF457 family)